MNTERIREEACAGRLEGNPIREDIEQAGKICVYQSTTVGHKHIATFPTVFTNKLRIGIDAEAAPHTMKTVSAHYLN